MRLEKAIVSALREIALREKCSVAKICEGIHESKGGLNLSAAVRQYVFLYFKAAATEEGHQKAGHGKTIKALLQKRQENS